MTSLVLKKYHMNSLLLHVSRAWTQTQLVIRPNTSRGEMCHKKRGLNRPYYAYIEETSVADTFLVMVYLQIFLWTWERDFLVQRLVWFIFLVTDDSWWLEQIVINVRLMKKLQINMPWMKRFRINVSFVIRSRNNN